MTQTVAPLEVAGTGGANSPRPASSNRVAEVTAPTRRRSLLTRDRVARAVIIGLFLGLAYRVGPDALVSGRPTGLLLLVSELLVVVLTLVRRPTIDIDRRWRVRLVAGLSIAGPLVLRPIAGADPSIETFTAMVSGLGLGIVVAAKIALGRSFGLLPANRGVVSSGLYRMVRHPIYLGYLFTHGAFLAANLSWWNVVALTIADAALLVRSSYEEHTLVQDPIYARYRSQVRWRLVPGMF